MPKRAQTPQGEGRVRSTGPISVIRICPYAPRGAIMTDDTRSAGGARTQPYIGAQNAQGGGGARRGDIPSQEGLPSAYMSDARAESGGRGGGREKWRRSADIARSRAAALHSQPPGPHPRAATNADGEIEAVVRRRGKKARGQGRRTELSEPPRVGRGKRTSNVGLGPVALCLGHRRSSLTRYAMSNASSEFVSPGSATAARGGRKSTSARGWKEVVGRQETGDRRADDVVVWGEVVGRVRDW
ncbi:hypothetical protein C8J57DRAFT_1622280 [Mycena rebaudengoi]|nr:hypothetical protein C8J57DRAFT_1622280 [Mycena rebaudengoi]